MTEDASIQAFAERSDDEKEFDEQKLAEMAWRRRKADAESENEDKAKAERRFYCIVM